MNEFELALMAAKKALQKQVDENPKSGVKSGDRKMRNVDALKKLDALYKFHMGRLAFGVCPNCGESCNG